MKIDIKTARSFLILVTLLLAGLSQDKLQAQTIREQLTGSWLFNDTASFSTIDPMFKAQIDTIPALKTKFMAVYSGRKLIFESNGDYTTILSDGRSSTGNWQVQGNNVLQVIDPSGTVYRYELVGIQPTSLVLIPIVAPDSKSMITQWHFNKL